MSFTITSIYKEDEGVIILTPQAMEDLELFRGDIVTVVDPSTGNRSSGVAITLSNEEEEDDGQPQQQLTSTTSIMVSEGIYY